MSPAARGNEVDHMTSSESPERGSRKFLWLSLGIVVAIAAYSAGWFYVGGRIERSVDETVRQAIADGGEATCTGREARGFPFRFGLFCDTVTFSDAPGGVIVEGSGLRTASQVYDPWRIVGELDDLKLRLAGDSGSLGVTGNDVRFSASLDDPLPQRASMTLADLSVEAPFAGEKVSTVLKALAGEAHMRQREGDLDLFIQGRTLRVSPPGLGTGLDLSRVELDLTVQDGVRLADASSESLRGASFVLRSASAFFTEEARISLSGPLAIGQDGLIDARLEVEMNRPAEVGEALAAAMPDQADQIRSAMAGLAMLGNAAALPLRIEKGRARIAFIQLGQLPALD